jgi:hypothetical protein
MNIKIFDKNMKSMDTEDFNYSIDKKYTIDNLNNNETDKKGFYYFDNTDDMLELEHFDNYDFFNTDKYRIFEVKPEGNLIKGIGKYYCSEITLINELSLENLINYDISGKYTWYYAIYSDHIKIDISKLEDIIMEKDIKGQYCYEFAYYVYGANISKLEDIVIKKDTTGYWCYFFALNIKGANISKLEDAVIEKDKTGEFCYYFAKKVKGTNINKLKNAIIKKDKTGEWYNLFICSTKITNKGV